jgi:hypothetical protein
MDAIQEAPAARAVHMCGRRLPHAAHICAFFDSEDQEYRCIAPYFAEGLEQGEQVVTIRDAGRCSEHVERLRPLISRPLDASIRSNQLRVVASEETYLKDGCFEAERMYRMLEDVLREAGSSPYKRVRTCGSMTWALREMPGTDELMEYEARVNQLTREHDCTLMCVYDVNKFSGRAVMDVLATHPMVVMGERIYENPYYVEPAEYLRTLVRRGSAPLARALT